MAAATLATYLAPPSGQGRSGPGCSPWCSAAPATTVAGAALLLTVAPHKPLMAGVALAATSVALLQRLTSAGPGCTVG